MDTVSSDTGNHSGGGGETVVNSVAPTTDDVANNTGNGTGVTVVSTSSSGEAKIKPEFLCKKLVAEAVTNNSLPVSNNNGKPADEETNKRVPTEDGPSAPKRSRKDRNRGQNKHRPGPHKFVNEGKLCSLLWDGDSNVKCPHDNCPFMHDIAEYLNSKDRTLTGPCPVFETFGKCPTGLACVFAASHMTSENVNVVNEELWAKSRSDYEKVHRNYLDKQQRNTLRKRQYDFSAVEKLCNKSLGNAGNKNNNSAANGQASVVRTSGAFTNEDSVSLNASEVKKIDWSDKLYLSPLTTVGNLPFRRICIEYGADITCSEMSLATSLLQGNFHEFALLKRHPCEKIWGVQLCTNNGFIGAKTAKLLSDVGVDYDFIDLNMGCPIENIFVQGAGSGLMCRKNKFQAVVRCMTGYLNSIGKPFTVKMRTGIKVGKNFAHDLIPFCRDNGVDLVTLHGRTKDQRYLRAADWDYIADCKKVAGPMPLYGNGDILSYEDYIENKKAGVDGVMIGRGALIKPWIFQEIKENRHIDMPSSERLEILRRYCHYGLDHWGSDSQGVETTRKFLLEFISFTHRYIPYGILVDPPQKINHRPPKYVGRDEMETLLSSPNVADWVKTSEMFLGPVPDGFQFLPKHKANAWG